MRLDKSTKRALDYRTFRWPEIPPTRLTRVRNKEVDLNPLLSRIRTVTAARERGDITPKQSARLIARLWCCALLSKPNC